MSQYVAATAGPTASLAILANTWQIRIIKMSWSGSASANEVVARFSGASLSGGTVITPVPFRQSAGAALATVKSGATVSGTSSTLHSNPTTSADGPYQPIADLIINPGSAFSWSIGNAFGTAVEIFFEELHLARSN